MLRLTASQAEAWQEMIKLGKEDYRHGLNIFDRPFPFGHEDKWLEKLAWRAGWQAEKTGKPSTIKFVVVEEAKCLCDMLNPRSF